MGLFSVLLADARKHRYAIPAINVHNAETVEAAFSAAANCCSPIIVAIAHSHAKLTYDYINLSTIAALVQEAKQRFDVKVCFHVDHGRNFDFIKQAIHSGVDSIMFDASELSFEENVRLVKEVTSYAHHHGVDVEAELGHVGKGQNFDTQEVIEDFFTKPEDAEKFVELTEVDALAVAFGTKHGIYKSQPKLDLTRLERIRELVNVPLVMHGTSGLSDSDIRRAIEVGISKVNVFTDPALAAKEAFLAACNDPKTRFPDALVKSRTAFQKRIEFYIELCQSAGRA
ncbi:class II fructose-bisphosphate aldolase [Alicyclobacillus dauci]|uniref:Class II fructose-bisphosphate aldolase n=1 Tax=Alicyclobacillus dauci TaxID=1475485 RepID=A0ABY6Z730_9BACL|nr:class II fructose-bisphosphate aldolase [Alicyclobacillus dauci]WAH37976.1 class II fructose-bisphosphate aldolase [Alicyclobacillus dauci]